MILPIPMPAHIRANGEIRASFARVGHRTGLARAHEAGGLRLRFPKGASGCEAVIINTGGGIAGGDTQAFHFEAGARADVTVTTQAAEKVYRADHMVAKVSVGMTLGAESRLEWLPQETILFDRSALHRTLHADMPASASLTLVESVIFGRLAMGEAAIELNFKDSWRIRREGELVFAEELALHGPAAATLDPSALGGGARAVATLLHVAPLAEARLEDVRAALSAEDCEAGASTWNNMLLVRACAPSPERVRAAIVAALRAIRGRAAPRVWQS